MSAADTDALAIALRAAAAFEAAGVRYFLGGSLASSLQGEPRATNDIDFVVEMAAWQLPALIAALGPEFSVEEEALREALRRGGSANVFFLPLVTKIDLFARGTAPFDDSEFARRQSVVVRADGATLWVKTPEDSVLRHCGNVSVQPRKVNVPMGHVERTAWGC